MFLRTGKYQHIYCKGKDPVTSRREKVEEKGVGSEVWGV